MGLSAGRGDEAHVSVVFGEKMENADEMTEGMDDAMFAKRFYCSKEQFAKISSKNVGGGSEEREDDDVYFLPRVRRETDESDARFKRVGRISRE